MNEEPDLKTRVATLEDAVLKLQSAFDEIAAQLRQTIIETRERQLPKQRPSRMN